MLQLRTDQILAGSRFHPKLYRRVDSGRRRSSRIQFTMGYGRICLDSRASKIIHIIVVRTVNEKKCSEGTGASYSLVGSGHAALENRLTYQVSSSISFSSLPLITWPGKITSLSSKQQKTESCISCAGSVDRTY